MKKIVNTARTPIMIDTDTLEVSTLDKGPRAIDEIYVIPEDATITWKKVNTDAEDRTVDVKKGDIMITFYDRDYKKDFVIVNGADEWKDAINNYNVAVQKRKEEWAAKHKSQDLCCGDCPNCPDCGGRESI